MGSLTGAIAGARGAVRLITRRPWSPILISPAPDLLLARRVHGGTGLPWSGMVSTPMLHGVGRRFVASSTTEAASRRRDRADGRERTGPARLTGPAPVRLYEAPARPFLKKDIDDLLQRAKSLKLYCSGGPRNNVTPEEDEQLLRAIARIMRESKQLVNQFSAKEWREVTQLMGYRRDARIYARRWMYSLDPNVRFGPWTEAEDKMLNALVEKHGSRWTLIGQDMPHRTKKQCFERYRNTTAPSVKKGRFSLEEDRLILEGVAMYPTGHRRWYYIAERIPGRTELSVKHRYERSLSPTLTSGAWTPAEDALLRKLFEKHGEGGWNIISKEMGGTRSSKQIQAHWQGAQFREDMLMGRWTEEADLHLAEAVAYYKRFSRGHWSDVAAVMGSRTANQCKWRWRTVIEAPVENVPMFDLNVKIADSEYDDVLEGCLETARHWRKKRAQRMQALRNRRLSINLGKKSERVARMLRTQPERTQGVLAAAIARIAHLRSVFASGAAKPSSSQPGTSSRTRLSSLVAKIGDRMDAQRARLTRLRSPRKAIRQVKNESVRQTRMVFGLSRNIAELTSRLAESTPGGEDSYYYVFNRALAYEKMASLDKALEGYTEALAIRPDHLAFMYRGMIHLRMNDYDAAASDINAALQLKPGMSQLLTAKATVDAAKEKAALEPLQMHPPSEQQSVSAG